MRSLPRLSRGPAPEGGAGVLGHVGPRGALGEVLQLFAGLRGAGPLQRLYRAAEAKHFGRNVWLPQLVQQFPPRVASAPPRGRQSAFESRAGGVAHFC